MKSSILRTTLAATIAGLVSGPSLAGQVITEGEDIIINTKGGFEAKTASENFSFKLGGRVQLQYDTYNDSMNLVDHEGKTGSDLFFRRARIYLKGTIYDDWAYKIQFNLVDDGDKGGVAEDLYVRWKKYQWFNVTAGKHKEPFSLQELTSSKWVTTVERSAIDDFIGEGRSIGVSVSGASNFGGYALGVYDNGKFDEDDGAQLWAVTGRAFLSPINTENSLLHVGVGFSARDADDSSDFYNGGSITQGIKKADEVQVAVDDAKSQTLFNIEAAGKIGPVHASAEYHQRNTEAANGGEDASADGYYVQGGWFITGESRAYKKGVWNKVKPNNKGLGAWEIFARAESIDLSDKGIDPSNQNEVAIYTVGANWYPNDIIRVSANYVQSNWEHALASDGDNLVRADSLLLPGTTEDTGSGFSIRLQAAF